MEADGAVAYGDDLAGPVDEMGRSPDHAEAIVRAAPGIFKPGRRFSLDIESDTWSALGEPGYPWRIPARPPT